MFHDNLDEFPFILTEAPFTPKEIREKFAEFAFETAGFPKLLLANQSVLSIYTSGKTTGLLLDCGEGVNHAVPLFEGRQILGGVKILHFGGEELTKWLEEFIPDFVFPKIS